MRILIESTPNYLNMGDLAMLQVCLRRLRAMWPDAELSAMTSDPDRLGKTCPGVRPVHIAARQLWFRPQSAYRKREWTLGESTLQLLQKRRPGLYLRTILSRMPRHSPAWNLLRDFFDALRAADLYVVAGMGSFTSDFEPDVLTMIRMIPLMRSLGVPCVAFSQGIGPIHPGSHLWTAAAEALPQLETIALRESRKGPGCLAELGVGGHRVAITGDDAIELAYERRSPMKTRSAIGLALRRTRYSAVGSKHEQQVPAVVSRLARELPAQILSTPVSYVPEESDAATFSRMFPESRVEDAPLAPEILIDRIGRCRFVITGAYHSAVFALSQGIPAICLANSDYYRDKFLGLAEQFGSGCRVVDLSAPGFQVVLADTARGFWRDAAMHRSPLLDRAAVQIEASRRAWATLSWRVRKTGTTPSLHSPASRLYN